MAPFYGWGSTASRLEPLRGGSLLFTTKFPEILWSLFPEEFKTEFYIHETEFYIHKCNQSPFHEEQKLFKFLNITVTESLKNVYQVTRQNLHFAHVPYNTKKLKMEAKEWTDNKMFRFSNDLFWTGLG